MMYYRLIQKHMPDGDDDKEIALAILKDIDSIDREEFTGRLDLMEEKHWYIKYLLIKLYLILHPEIEKEVTK